MTWYAGRDWLKKWDEKIFTDTIEHQGRHVTVFAVIRAFVSKGIANCTESGLSEPG